MDKKNSHTIVLPTVIHSSGQGQKPKLLVTAGPLEGREYMILKFPFTIGSGLSNELSIADSTVSRRHCEINLDEHGSLVINDLGSTNGTAIEGVKVTSARLQPNTEVQLGRTRIIVPLVQDRLELVMSARELFGKSIGRTPLIRHVFYLAENAAQCDSPVLLLGESGTGKEELAEDIHNESARRDKPFIVLDCNAFASLEHAHRELFGASDVKGALELASGGTLFVDSLDRLPADAQPLLLRALETRKDIRFIAASNQELGTMARDGAFYAPLFYAFAVIVIEMPALRRRKDDIALLLLSLAERLHVSEEIVRWCEQPSTIAFLRRYNWPGNIREMRLLLERLHSLGRIPADLGTFMRGDVKLEDENDSEESHFSVSADRPFKDLKNELIEAFERRYLSDLLARNAQNISLSARQAGIERAYLQRLVRKYGMRNTD
ncbi:MAG: sigma 54-interacting transcriptional regulator [Kiritimatiellae bacterium]|nr:sigma 54-interacting transcriptional regulator [Kiritimatiellia bacterium]